MKHTLIALVLLSITWGLNAQCSTVGVQISSSDTSSIQLYHAGFFNIPSGFDNICEWEVTTFDGEIIHQATTSGEFVEQSNSSFDHNVPLTDSMKATIVITNNTEGIICTMRDTLYWEEIEILPDAFVGNWAVLSNNGGIEEEITSADDFNVALGTINLFPSPAYDHFQVSGQHRTYSLSLIDVNGREVANYTAVQDKEAIDISTFASGVYFVRIRDKNKRLLDTQKLIKR